MTHSETHAAIREAGVADADLTRIAINAVSLSMVSLIDWVRTTGHGEVCARVVDGKRGTLKPNTWYQLGQAGKFVEVK